MTKIFVENKICKPTVANKGDAGIDLRYSGDKSFEIKKGIVYKIPTSTYVEIPEGKCGIIMERSGLGLKGINVMGRIIDAPYRGQICIIIDRNSDIGMDLTEGGSDYTFDIPAVVVKPGDKIAQMVIVDIYPEFELIDSKDKLSDTSRGEKGFGSSDKK